MKTDTVRFSETERGPARLSDFVPGDMSLFDGEFAIDGDASVRCTGVTGVGDLCRTGILLEAEGGQADYTMLSGRHYLAEWGTYRFGSGLVLAAWMDNPMIELHFQLEGSTPKMRTSIGIDLDLHAGQSNLAFVPYVGGSFQMQGDAEGASFSIALSDRFFTDLSERHPELLDTDLSIGAISRRIGYRDPAHLTNAFRKRFGIRPSDLRQRNGAARSRSTRSNGAPSP